MSRRFALVLAASALVAARGAAQDPAARGPAKPTRLFSSDSIFSLTIASDIKKYMGTRDSTAPWLPARLLAGGDTLRVGLRPRGHYRKKPGTCSFPPVSVKFENHVKGTEFAKQGKLKLVTVCWPGQAVYETYIPQEYLLYRIYNLITPFSFRARYVHVSYVDTAHADRPAIVAPAFFVEDAGDMAARNGGDRIAARNAGRDDFDPAALTQLLLFEYMIGNGDFGIAAEHNVRFVRTGQFGLAVPVPYDFDFSGVVDALYARPDLKAFPIHTVRDRIWIGYCFTPAELAPAIAVFNARRAAITALYAGNPLLDAKVAASDLAYFDGFFALINDAKALNKEIQKSCAG